MVAQRERLLRPGPKSYSPVFDMRDSGVRFHRKVLHSWKGKGVFKNVLRLPESFVHVSVGITETIAKIGAGKLLGSFVMLSHHLAAPRPHIVHQRRAGR